MKGLFILVFSPFFPKNEYYDAWRYIGKKGYTIYPFKKSINYKKLSAKVFHDEKNNLPYIIHNGKKLYFLPSTITPDVCVEHQYKSLLIEQDFNSPHRYVDSYEELRGKTLLDIGAAEGIFALDAIEYVKKVYLFECEDKWEAPLRATFEPWKDKVEIIKKYVGNSNEGDFTTIDTFMKDKDKNDIHIKMDIEGYELDALEGAKNLLTNGKSISLSVCTYHKENDDKDISSFFELLGYSHYLTHGVMFFQNQFRKAICRAKK
jgi:hypothetical protein